MKKLFSVVALLVSLAYLGAMLFPAEAHALAYALPHGADVAAALGGSGVSLALCPPLLNVVADDCGANPGGLVDYLSVIRRRDIETFPEPGPDGVTLAAAIVPKTGKAFTKMDFATDTGEITHKSTGDIGNQSVSAEVGVNVPRGTAAIDSAIQALLNGDYVVIGRDGNGNQRVLGDKRRGAKFEHDYKSGKKGTDKNGTDFKFTGEGFAHVPYYYTAAIPYAA